MTFYSDVDKIELINWPAYIFRIVSLCLINSSLTRMMRAGLRKGSEMASLKDVRRVSKAITNQTVP